VESDKNYLNVVVIGSGTMGTALAHVIASAGHSCTLLTDDVEVAKAVNTLHRHPVFFEGLTIHDKVKGSTASDACIPDAELLVMAVPSHNMREVARQIRHLTKTHQSVLSVTKGFEPVTHKLMSQVLREELETLHIGTLSGPNITLDLVRNLPTMLLVSSSSQQMLDHGRLAFSSSIVNVAVSKDIQTFEYISALKNCVAIEVGIVTGLELGDNFRALVLAKGMAEISRLLKRMGLHTEAFYGLAGLSDIFLTCSSHFAKNYAIGLQLGSGASLTQLLEALKEQGEVAEGLESVKAGHSLAQKFDCEAPLLEAAHRFIYRNASGEFGKDHFISAAFKDDNAF
jgi:glycerol-3-phosphate dehydrogenase (NAD(P)+)